MVNESKQDFSRRFVVVTEELRLSGSGPGQTCDLLVKDLISNLYFTNTSLSIHSFFFSAQILFKSVSIIHLFHLTSFICLSLFAVSMVMSLFVQICQCVDLGHGCGLVCLCVAKLKEFFSNNWSLARGRRRLRFMA